MLRFFFFRFSIFPRHTLAVDAATIRLMPLHKMLAAAA